MPVVAIDFYEGIAGFRADHFGVVAVPGRVSACAFVDAAD